VRVDTLIAELRAGEPARASSHRGQRQLTLTDAELRQVVDAMVAEGVLRRAGHRVQLPDGGLALDPIMRLRVDELLRTLTGAGAKPPPTEAVAARLGIPAPMVDQLRASGELVSFGQRIDVTREAWMAIAARLDRLASDGELSVTTVRDELETSRRFAEAILQHWNRLRSHQ
jgi:selenocysteine-specific elongation factor